MCPSKYKIYTSKKMMNCDRQGPKSFEANARALVAFRGIRNGLTGIETFSNCMKMPGCIMQKSYDSPNKTLHYYYNDISQRSQKVAANVTRENLGVLGDTTISLPCFCQWFMAEKGLCISEREYNPYAKRK